MEVAYQRGGRVGESRTTPPNDRSNSPKSSLHVGFNAPLPLKERKEKYLTAKYGSHQMALIRKRLNVELWLCDTLQAMYPDAAEDKEIDLDHLLDLEGDVMRRGYLVEQLEDCPPHADKEKFIVEVLERAKKL